MIPEWRQWRHSDIFNLEQIAQNFIVFIANFDKFHRSFLCFYGSLKK